MLRSLGRDGVAELIERCCAHTRRFAEQLARIEGVEVLNDVTLNQALVRFGDDDEITQRVISRIQDSGECWFGGTKWRGVGAMRVSVVSWQTTTEDVDRSIEVIRQAAQQELGAVPAVLG